MKHLTLEGNLTLATERRQLVGELLVAALVDSLAPLGGLELATVLVGNDGALLPIDVHVDLAGELAGHFTLPDDSTAIDGGPGIDSDVLLEADIDLENGKSTGLVAESCDTTRF